MDRCIFRRAHRNDLEEILYMLSDDLLGQRREKTSEKIADCYLNAFEKIEADPNQFLMVVELDNKIVGTCHLSLIPSLTHQGGLRMNIEAVRVDSSHRGKGVGKWMMDQAILLARKLSCKIIQLTTDKTRAQAKQFYEQLGFIASHEGMKIYL
jgi:GNAT superfamily N-acetyltransferase